MLNCDQKCSSVYHLTGVMHFSRETIRNNCFGGTLAALISEHSVTLNPQPFFCKNVFPYLLITPKVKPF